MSETLLRKIQIYIYFLMNRTIEPSLSDHKLALRNLLFQTDMIEFPRGNKFFGKVVSCQNGLQSLNRSGRNISNIYVIVDYDNKRFVKFMFRLNVKSSFASFGYKFCSDLWLVYLAVKVRYALAVLNIPEVEFQICTYAFP